VENEEIIELTGKLTFFSIFIIHTLVNSMTLVRRSDTLYM